MTAAANPIGGAVQAVAPIHIEEDSPVDLIRSRFPLTGSFLSSDRRKSLVEKINDTEEPARLIELIKVKNKYVYADMDRNLITAAFLVANVAMSIISSTWGYMGAGVMVGGAALHLYIISHNTEVIKELQTTGEIKPGMKVL